MTYKIAHITDIANVPTEHWDELFDDLRHGLTTLLAINAAMVAAGEHKPLAETCPCITFSPDGKREVSVSINGSHLMTSTMKVTP
jgi:hypothetical protein